VSVKKRFLISMLGPLALTAVAGAQTSNSSNGLNSLDEQRVQSELADQGLQTLLNREFEVNHTPAAQQTGLLTLLSIHKLSDPDSKLTLKERQDLLAKISAGIETAMVGINDPTALMQLAKVLVTASVDPDINALEYWGENSRTQDRVRPTVQMVLKIYQKASANAASRADQIANQLTANDEATAKRWQTADDLHNLANFNELMADYDLCLSLDKSDPQRADLADKAIEGLKQFDTNDSAVQAAVRNRIAKLNMTRGDFDIARQIFATVANNPDSQIKPPPTAAEQYEARYFSVVSEILSNNLPTAAADADTLETWQRRNLDKDQQQGASAAFAMLQYRLLSARSDQATDPDEKKRDDNQAIATLLQLLKDQPQYKTVIFEQVLSRMPADPDLSTLDPLLLLALQQEGEEQFLLPAGQKPDEKIVDRAIAAARQVIAHRGQSGVDEATGARSAYVVPYLLEKLGRTKEAATAFLDFAEQFPLEIKDANDALDHATALIGQLRKDDPEDQETRKLYDRFLPLAIGSPFNRRQFAFEYAVLLQREQQYRKAIQYFLLVPPDDSRITAVRFYLMVALKQRLDDQNDKISPGDRQQILGEVQSLADQVTHDSIAARNAATTDEDRKRYASRIVRTALIAAGTAMQEQNDPKRAIDLLNGFEGEVKGLPDEQNLLFEALSLRVSAQMQLGQTTAATDALVQLLKTKQGNEGPALVFDLLKKIDADMDRAKAAGDAAQVRQLAQNRAILSGFLVTWAQNNPDEKIKALTSRYKVFDASTNRLAAELSDDPVARKAGLEAALKQYQDLYDAKNPDSIVQLGLGMVQFDLGNFQAAKEMLGPLVVNKKIGTATVTIQENGEPKTVENPQYWETILKLLQSVAAVAKQNPTDPAATADLASAKTFLKQLWVQWPKTIGGKKYHDDFEKLRTEMIPDFNFEHLLDSTTPGNGG
jgi:hypothetical protein